MTLKNGHLFYLSFVKQNFAKLPIIFQERCVIFALTELTVHRATVGMKWGTLSSRVEVVPTSLDHIPQK